MTAKSGSPPKWMTGLVAQSKTLSTRSLLTAPGAKERAVSDEPGGFYLLIPPPPNYGDTDRLAAIVVDNLGGGRYTSYSLLGVGPDEFEGAIRQEGDIQVLATAVEAATVWLLRSTVSALIEGIENLSQEDENE